MAISTDINYPSEYLPCPLKENFGLKPTSPLISTTMVTGRRKQRRAYASTPTQTPVAWIFTDGQAQYFEAWVRDTLVDGANWFNMPLLTPLGQQDYVCRFTDDFYDGPTPEGGMYWRYTATLELWERPILPPGWAEFPDYIVNSDILDLALNSEWPEA